MEYDEVRDVVNALVSLAEEKGAEFKEGQHAYALGWVSGAMISAICKLSNKNRRVVCNDILSGIEWSKKTV